MGSLFQLVLAVLAVSAAVVVLSLTLAVIRLARLRAGRRRAGLAGPLRSAVLALATGEAPAAGRAPAAGGDPGAAGDGGGDPARALAGLGRGQWRAVEPTVLALIAKVRGDARSSLIEILRRRGAYEDACRQAGSRRARRRAAGADRLGLLGDRAAEARLIDLLGDRNPQVRRVAARAASRMPSAEVARALLAGLGGERTIPPRIVAQALQRIGPPAVPVLVGAARPDRAGSAGAAQPDQVERAAATAIEVLGLMRRVEAVPVLLDALGHAPEEERIRAARALGRIGSPEAVPALLDAAAPGRPRPLRIVALGALAGIGDRRVVPDLEELVGDDDGRVAAAAGRVLAALGEPGEAALRRVAGVAVGAVPGTGPAALHARAALVSVELARDRAGRRSSGS